MSENTKKRCLRCGQLFDEEHSGDYCSRCQIEMAEEKMEKAPDATVTPAKSRKHRFPSIFKWLILAVCIGIIAYNLFILSRLFIFKEETFKEPTVDKDAVLCMANLEEIKELLKKGESPGDTFVCPVSGLAYKIEISGNDTIIFCPNPEKHGFKQLKISLKDSLAEVIK